jgi:alkanesulfonate monooxygenase SsuD/methylene tetrahydromethanopterin reductase-like flavin-dependent oxidoreductase (luciferase family)
MASMDDNVKLGVLIPIGQAQWGPGGDPRSLPGFAVRAEELGYASVWVNDFLLTPRIEALTMLAAVAPLTSRVLLGTSALLPVLRRPVQAAQTLASIDVLSAGRLVLTVGAAFPGRFGVPQHALSEVPWERRFARLDETVALWRQLWSPAAAEEPSGDGPSGDGPSGDGPSGDGPSGDGPSGDGPSGGSFHGELLRFDDLPPMTAPARPGGPPIWLGGASDSALRRVGRAYDGWMPYPPEPSQYASGLAAAREAAGAAGRDAAAITPALFVSVVLTDTVERGRTLLDEFARASYGLPADELEKIQALAAGPADYVAEKLAGYVAAGARHFAIRIATTSLATQREQLEQIITLAPLLKGASHA